MMSSISSMAPIFALFLGYCQSGSIRRDICDADWVCLLCADGSGRGEPLTRLDCYSCRRRSLALPPVLSHPPAATTVGIKVAQIDLIEQEATVGYLGPFFNNILVTNAPLFSPKLPICDEINFAKERWRQC